MQCDYLETWKLKYPFYIATQKKFPSHAKESISYLSDSIWMEKQSKALEHTSKKRSL